jgi:hypothetical protein
VNSKVTILLSGNTTGTNAIVAHNIVLVGGSNVTLSGDPRGSVLFVAGGGGGTGSGGTTSYTSIYSITTHRSNAWSLMGVAVQSDDPGAGVQYSQWVAGSNGYWGWYRIP